MVKSTEHGPRAHFTDYLDLARHWGVPVQRQVGPGLVVVVDVLPQDAEEMPPSERDEMVRALPADRSDLALSESVLPRGPWSAMGAAQGAAE